MITRAEFGSVRTFDRNFGTLAIFRSNMTTLGVRLVFTGRTSTQETDPLVICASAQKPALRSGRRASGRPSRRGRDRRAVYATTAPALLFPVAKRGPHHGWVYMSRYIGSRGGRLVPALRRPVRRLRGDAERVSPRRGAVYAAAPPAPLRGRASPPPLTRWTGGPGDAVDGGGWRRRDAGGFGRRAGGRLGLTGGVPAAACSALSAP